MKRYLKTILYFLSYLIYYNRCSKILYLHDVHDGRIYAESDCSMSIEIFEDVISIIRKNGFTIVDKITERYNQIQICFDDGYRGIWDTREYFYNESIAPTIFVAYNLIGSDNYLTKSEIIELSNHGFNIQSHTMDHIALTGLQKENLEYQLKQSRDNLSVMTNCVVTEICLPIGWFDLTAIVNARRFYKVIYSSIPGNYFDMRYHGMICRNIIQNLTPRQIKYTLYGGQQLMCKRIFKQHSK